MSDLDIAATIGFWAPRATPDAVIRTLSRANAVAVKSADVTEALRKQDTVPIGSTPEEFLRSFERDVRFYREALRLAGNKPL